MEAIGVVEVDRETLLSIRRGKKFRQDQLAESAGIGLRTYQQIEKGETENPGIQTLSKICDALGVHLLQILREV